MSSSPISLTAPGRGLAVPALPLVPGADLRFAPISRPETTPHTPLGITADETPVQAHLCMGLGWAEVRATVRRRGPEGGGAGVVTLDVPDQAWP